MSPEPLPDVLEIAADIAMRLEAAAIPYVIGGSLASSIHGEPRATMDVDVVADIPLEEVGRVCAALRPDYYVDEGAARNAVLDRGSFNAVHMHAGVKVDFFVAGSDAFERERLRTRIAVPVRQDPPLSLWFDSAEHTILRKLEWFRRGGETSDRQWRDIQAIISLQRENLDRAELRRWADSLGVVDLLQQCLGDDG